MASYDGTSTIMTRSGRLVDLVGFTRDCVCLEDIAWALATIPRFGGHAKIPYTVAEHSVFVSNHLPPHLALQGLLHDASEAYVLDLPKPLKRLLPSYVEIERAIQAVIFEFFALPPVLDPEVKVVDVRALATEGRDLMHANWEWQKLPHPPYEERVVPRSREAAAEEFLATYQKITSTRRHMKTSGDEQAEKPAAGNLLRYMINKNKNLNVGDEEYRTSRRPAARLLADVSREQADFFIAAAGRANVDMVWRKDKGDGKYDVLTSNSKDLSAAWDEYWRKYEPEKIKDLHPDPPTTPNADER